MDKGGIFWLDVQMCLWRHVLYLKPFWFLLFHFHVFFPLLLLLATAVHRSVFVFFGNGLANIYTNDSQFFSLSFSFSLSHFSKHSFFSSANFCRSVYKTDQRYFVIINFHTDILFANFYRKNILIIPFWMVVDKNCLEVWALGSTNGICW